MTHVAMTCSGPGLRYHMANDDGAGFITTCVDVGALNLTKVRAHKCAVLCCAVLCYGCVQCGVDAVCVLFYLMP